MDSFITEDIDGRKVSVTRQVSSRKIQRIIYSDLVIIKHIEFNYQRLKYNTW